MNVISWLFELPASFFRFIGALLWKILGVVVAIFVRLFSPVWKKIEPLFLLKPSLGFAIVGIFIAVVLFASKSLVDIDSDLTSLVYQMGYVEQESKCNIVIVKKDEKTSSMLGKAISRRDFASIIRFVSQDRDMIVPTSDGSEPIGRWKFLELKIGLLKNGPRGAFTFPWLFDNLPTGDPEGETLFTYFQDLPRLLCNFLISTNQFDALPPLSEIHFASFSAPIKDAHIASIAVPLSHAVASFAENLARSYLSVQVRVFPKPNIPLQFSLWLFVNKTIQYRIPPASVIGWDIMLQDKREKEKEEDDLLVEAIKNSSSPIVLGAQIDKNLSKTRVDYLTMVSDTDPKKPQVQEKQPETSLILPHSQFQVGNFKLGLINVAPDGKNNVARIPLFHYVPEKDVIMPAFPLMIAIEDLERRATGTPGLYRKSMEDEFRRILPEVKAKTYAGGLQLYDRYIPTDQSGQMILYFAGSTQNRVFKGVSACEAFDAMGQEFYQNRTAESATTFKNPALSALGGFAENYGNRIILFGTYEKSDFDYYPTPMTLNSPVKPVPYQLMGIEIHANAIENILNKRHVRPENLYHTLILLVVCTVLQGLLIEKLSSLGGAILTMLFLGGIFGWGYISYNLFFQIFLFSPFFISFPLTWIMTAILNEVRERKRANMTKAMFQRFVAPEVVQYLIDNPGEVKPGGQKKELSIFFSDLAGFTTISESLTPEQLVELMNEYLGEMTEIIFKHNGTLDKYIGDAIMAYWNFPKNQSDHAIRACLYTLDCHERLTQLQKDWANRGLPRAYARAGVNTAKVVVGCMGSSKVQMNFTCLGDGVNLASRLEGANKEYGTLYMISDSTYQQAKDHIVSRFLDFLAVKGKKEPVKVHQLIAQKGKEPLGWNEVYPIYQKGIDLHLERKWDPAIACFEDILRKWPDDGPSKTYLNRCFEYKENPPPENWDGSYHLTHK